MFLLFINLLVMRSILGTCPSHILAHKKSNHFLKFWSFIGTNYNKECHKFFEQFLKCAAFFVLKLWERNVLQRVQNDNLLQYSCLFFYKPKFCNILHKDRIRMIAHHTYNIHFRAKNVLYSHCRQKASQQGAYPSKSILLCACRATCDFSYIWINLVQIFFPTPIYLDYFW